MWIVVGERIVFHDVKVVHPAIMIGHSSRLFQDGGIGHVRVVALGLVHQTQIVDEELAVFVVDP